MKVKFALPWYNMAMIGKLIIGIILLLLVFTAGNAFVRMNKEKDLGGRVTPTASITSGGSASVPTMREEDVIRLFFELINEGKIPEAISMQTDAMVPDESAKQQWGVTWNSFDTVSVLGVTLSTVTPPTDSEKVYKVDLMLRMKPNNQTMWTDGADTRWVMLVKEGTLWKIDEIATGP